MVNEKADQTITGQDKRTGKDLQSLSGGLKKRNEQTRRWKDHVDGSREFTMRFQ